METIRLRPVRLKDAQPYYELLFGHEYPYFPPGPATLEAEKAFLRECIKKRAEGLEYNYGIVYEGGLVGGVGLKLDPALPGLGEIGYFVDRSYQCRGIATTAVGLIEQMGINELGLSGFEIIMHPKNLASIKVAEKSGYKKVGFFKERVRFGRKYKHRLVYEKRV
jgi:[ribosomal protein S5]-alanine N-acetyltransferase